MEVSHLLQKVLSKPTPLLLAFDLDGTLIEISEDPNQTTMPEDVLSMLDTLSRFSMLRIAIVTGRDLRAFNRMVTLTNIWRVVEHGGLIFAPGQAAEAPLISHAQEATLKRFEAWARAQVIPLGADFETKRTARGIHVRRLSAFDEALAERIIQEASDMAVSMGLHVRLGRKMVEADAVHGDKVTALQDIWKASGAKGIFFAGDDFTDFESIRFAQQQGGIGVFVRSLERKTGPSSMVLEGPSEVKMLLSQMIDVLGKRENHSSDGEIKE